MAVLTISDQWKTKDNKCNMQKKSINNFSGKLALVYVIQLDKSAHC